MTTVDQAPSVTNIIGAAIPARFSLRRVATHLTHAQNEYLRAAVRAIVAEKCEGNASVFARTIGRSQPTVSDFLSGKTGMSYATVKAIAWKYNRTLDSLIGKDEGRLEVDVERDAAIQAAQLLNFDKAAIARVLAENRTVLGKSRRWWFALFEAEAADAAPASRARPRVAR